MGLTAAQRAERPSRIGGSDAAAVLGLSPWRSALDVYLEKIGEKEPEDLSSKNHVRAGNDLEPIVAKWYEQDTGHKLRRRRQAVVHPELPFIGGFIDRKVEHADKLVEIKTTSCWAGRDLGNEGGDEVPDVWLIQVHHYMLASGYRQADIAALIGGQDFRIYSVPFDQEIADMLVERETRFWREHVEKRVPPPPSTLSDLSLLYPKDSGGTVTATPDMLVALAELKAAKQQAKVLEAHQTALEFTVKAALGESSTLVDASGTPLATWRSQTVNRLDQARLKKEAPEVFQSFTTASTHRVLRLR